MAKSKPKAFIIHGRDLEARDALKHFLQALQLKVLSFEDVSAELGPNPFIADIVLAALKQADILVALFTPDEQAALFDPESGRGVDNEARWQARPNVIFEAGVAFGLHREKTILLTLGADVSLFSDLGGVHIIEMSRPESRDRFVRVLRAMVPAIGKNEARADSQLIRTCDFKKVLRKRWKHFDEGDATLTNLRLHEVGRGKFQSTLLNVLRKVAKSNENSPQILRNPKVFMQAVAKCVTPAVASEVFWWLLVYGFFRFEDVDYWFDNKGDDWEDGIDYCVFSDRAKSIWDRICADVR
jgi:Predicted nucleotide-binding protein containing TIR-like domain